MRDLALGRRLNGLPLASSPYLILNHLLAQFNKKGAELAHLEALPKSYGDRCFLPDGNNSVRDLRALALQTLEEAGEDRNEFLTELTPCRLQSQRCRQRCATSG